MELQEEIKVVVKNRVGRPRKNSPPREVRAKPSRAKIPRKPCIRVGCENNSGSEDQVCSKCRLKETHYHRDYHRANPNKQRQNMKIKKLVDRFDNADDRVKEKLIAHIQKHIARQQQ